MQKFRKKPVVIEAIQWDGTELMAMDIIKWMGKGGYRRPDYKLELNPELVIPTLEGEMVASSGDWIIKGIAGEFYPCKDEIFKRTYEPAGNLLSTPLTP
jgi:hypothetical protein